MLPTAPFGRTGHHSTRVIFGAAGLGSMSQDRADATLALARELGINHLDTAAGYGESEVLMAPFLSEHRDEVFLATKTDQRTAALARRQLEASLSRMGVEQIDLVQLHNLVEEDEWRVAHGRGGALEALVAARDEGLVRFIGVTGHGVRIPSMHLRSLREFDYDSVLLPYSYPMLARPDYRADVEQLLALCAEREVAVQTIKAVARRRWEDGDASPRYSWYEPLRDEGAIENAVGFVLSQPRLFLNSSSDARLLPATVAAAGRVGRAPDPAVMEADMARLGIASLFDGDALERI